MSQERGSREIEEEDLEEAMVTTPDVGKSSNGRRNNNVNWLLKNLWFGQEVCYHMFSDFVALKQCSVHLINCKPEFPKPTIHIHQWAFQIPVLGCSPCTMSAGCLEVGPRHQLAMKAPRRGSYTQSRLRGSRESGSSTRTTQRTSMSSTYWAALAHAIGMWTRTEDRKLWSWRPWENQLHCWCTLSSPPSPRVRQPFSLPDVFCLLVH